MVIHLKAVVAWSLLLFGLVDAQLSAEKRAEIHAKCVAKQQYLSIGIDLTVLGDTLTVAITNSSGDPGNITFLQHLQADEDTYETTARLRAKTHNEKELRYNELADAWKENLRKSESWKEYLLRLPKRLSTFSGAQKVLAESLDKMGELKIHQLSEAPEALPAPLEVYKAPEEEPSYYDEMVETFFNMINGTKSVMQGELGISTDTSVLHFTLSFPPYFDESAFKFVTKALQDTLSKSNVPLVSLVFHTDATVVGANIGQGPRVLEISLSGWESLNLAIKTSTTTENSVRYPDAKPLLRLVEAMKASAVSRAKKEGTWDGTMQLDADEDIMVGNLILAAMTTFKNDTDVQELPLVFTFGKPEVLFEGVLLRSDLETHEAFLSTAISGAITKFMTYPTKIDMANVKDYNKNVDVYGPLTKVDAVVIVADLFGAAKLAERAAIMAGIEVPIYGAKGFEDMQLRARGAALHSVKVGRNLVEQSCEVYVNQVENLQKTYCVNGKNAYCRELLGYHEL